MTQTQTHSKVRLGQRRALTGSITWPEDPLLQVIGKNVQFYQDTIIPGIQLASVILDFLIVQICYMTCL